MTIRKSTPVKLRSRFQASIASTLLGVSCAVCGPSWLAAQSLGAGTIKGIVTDATGAALPSATIDLANALTGYSRQARTGADGGFAVEDIPQNSYVVRVKREGFQTWTQTVAIRTTVPIELKIQLAVAGQQDSVTVEAQMEGLVENTAVASHTVDQLTIGSASESFTRLRVERRDHLHNAQRSRRL